MILKSTRISTSSGAGGVGGHVLSGAGNESIEVLEGSPDDLNDMVADARDVGAKYCIRHVVISPKEAMTREQAEAVAAQWRAEFQTGDRPWMLVEHKKKRADGTGHDRHWHMLVGEVSPSTGRVLSCRNDFARQEKVARLAELALGHQVIAGRHNKAVVAALAGEGRTAEADALRHLTAAPLPNSAYTSDSFQIAKRNGLNKAEATAAVRAAWERSDGPKAFAAALAEVGLAVEQGAKKWIVVGTDKDGARVELGSVDRLARIRNAEVVAVMSGLQSPMAGAAGHRGGAHIKEQEADVRKAEHPTVAGLHAGSAAAAAGPHAGQRLHDGESRPRGQGDGRGAGEAGRGTGNRRADPATPRNGGGEAGGHGREAERLDVADARRRVEARRLEAGFRQVGGGRRVESLVVRVQALGKEPAPKAVEPKTAQPKAFAKAGGMPAVRTGNNPAGGGGGGKSGRSMEAALHAGTGWIEAPEQSGGDGPPPMHENDSEELTELSQKVWETLKGLGRKLFGGRASESPPSPKVSAPPPPGGGTGTGEPVHAVAKADQVEPKRVPADPAAELGRDLAAYLRKIDRGTLKDGKLLAAKLDRQPKGRKLRQVVDAMHGDAELADFAKRLPKSSPPSEVIRRIEEEARRRQREAEQRQRERTAERTQVAKHGAQPSGPALRMGR